MALMIWGLVLLILLVALSIPIVAIVLNSPTRRSLALRASPEEIDRIAALGGRVQAIEDEVDELGQVVRELQEETRFLHKLLQQPEEPPPLAPPKS